MEHVFYVKYMPKQRSCIKISISTEVTYHHLLLRQSTSPCSQAGWPRTVITRSQSELKWVSARPARQAGNGWAWPQSHWRQSGNGCCYSGRITEAIKPGESRFSSGFRLRKSFNLRLRAFVSGIRESRLRAPGGKAQWRGGSRWGPRRKPGLAIEEPLLRRYFWIDI